MSIIYEARKIRESFLKMREGASDAVASTCPELFPVLRGDGSLIKAGTRINWNNVIKRAAVDLWDIESNNPDNAPTIWEDLEYKEGYRVIPDTVTAGTAFALNEYGWWEGVLYKSLIDYNVYTPVQYSAGWELVIL